MIFPGETWETASPESQQIDPQKLEEAINYLKNNTGRDGVEELLVIRNGFMVWEGDSIDKVHNVWSQTKSFTSTVLGLLIDDQKASLNTLAKDYVPELEPNYPEVSLRHFTTMTSGYKAKGDTGASHGQSNTPFIPASPLYAPPGSKFAYWDSAMNQFANILTVIAGEPIEALFKRRIADNIGMDAGSWDWQGWKDVREVVVNGGAGNKGKGIHISARTMARFGHLMLNQGKWKGDQLISSSWVDAASSVQVPASLPLGHPESGIKGPGLYGYNWWVNGRDSDGPKWPGAPVGTYSASGHNNNDMFIIPEWNMVIVRLGLDQNDFKITDKIYGTFLEKVGQAMK